MARAVRAMQQTSTRKPFNIDEIPRNYLLDLGDCQIPLHHLAIPEGHKQLQVENEESGSEYISRIGHDGHCPG